MIPRQAEKEEKRVTKTEFIETNKKEIIKKYLAGKQTLLSIAKQYGIGKSALGNYLKQWRSDGSMPNTYRCEKKWVNRSATKAVEKQEEAPSTKTTSLDDIDTQLHGIYEVLCTTTEIVNTLIVAGKSQHLVYGLIPQYTEAAINVKNCIDELAEIRETLK